MSQSHYSETIRYRCLKEGFPLRVEAIRLLLCGVEQCAPDKERLDRVREDYHLHVVLSGEGVVETGNTRTMIRAGQMFLIKPGERIAYWPVRENPWTYCWMSFNGAHAAAYAADAGFTEGINTQDCHVEREQFFRLCEKLLNTPEDSVAAALKRLGLLLEFIGLCIDSFERRAGDRGSREQHRKGEYVRHAIDYILNHYEGVSVGGVANYLGIDRSYFSTIFRQSQGISPNEFILRVRMKESSHMLLNQSIEIQDIAHRVGYEDSLTFSKAFRRFFGVSPKYFRDMSVDDRPKLADIIAERNKDAQRE